MLIFKGSTLGESSTCAISIETSLFQFFLFALAIFETHFRLKTYRVSESLRNVVNNVLIRMKPIKYEENLIYLESGCPIYK